MGGPIDLDAFLPTVKEAARSQASVAWVGRTTALLCIVLGAVPPEHWALLGIGVALMGAMTWSLVRKVADLRAAHRLARRP